jgi:hypothetical protein
MTDERLGPPPVEPMSDVAWSRIERGLWARMDAAETSTAVRRAPLAPRRWWIVAAPLVAAAAAAAIVLGTRPSIKEVPAADEPARVVSGSTPSSVSFGDSHLELDAATAVVMNHENGHPTVLLERGAAWFTVAPRLERPEFIVRAGDAMVRVVGTRFRVARSEERIAVEVERGLVDVQFRGGVVKVGASQRWSSEAPAALSVVAAGTATPVDPIASNDAATAPVAEAIIDPTSGPARTKVEPKPAVRSPHKAEPKIDHKAELKLDTKVDPKPGEAPTVSDVDRDRAEYERLAGIEPKRPAAALDGYLTLARGTSRWADLALFAAARLAADRHDRRAETLLGIYLQRFPHGANAADARQLLDHLRASRP